MGWYIRGEWGGGTVYLKRRGLSKSQKRGDIVGGGVGGKKKKIHSRQKYRLISYIF